MQIRELTEDEILPILAKEYKSDFPRNQRKADAEVLRMLALNTYKAYGFCDDEGNRVGYFFGYEAKQYKTLILDYFAIAKKLRGKKLGSTAVELIATDPLFKKFDAFVVEMDDPKYIWFNKKHKNLAVRKLNFAKREGYCHTGVVANAFGAHLIVMRKVREGKRVSTGEVFLEQMNDMYKSIYGTRAKRIKTKLVEEK